MTNFNKLKKDLLFTASKEVKDLGKKFAWLKFASKTKSGGYRFLGNKEKQWQVLDKIAKKVEPKHPKYTYGQIIDILCNLVNKHFPPGRWHTQDT